jgi:putative GTP pyrophosphokinase
MIHVHLPPKSKTELEAEYAEHADSFERALYELHRRLRVMLEQRRIRATVKYRVKSFSSYYAKILKRSTEVNGDPELLISDVLGMRIVCPFLDDLAAVEDLLNQNFAVAEREKKGAEFSFKEFGYDSLHFLIELPEDVVESFHLPGDLLAEVQLRTILQDAWAEVEHEMVYKSQITPFDANLRRKLAALNANLSLSDMIFHEIRIYQRELQHQLDRRRVAFMSMVQQEEMLKDQQLPVADPEKAGNFPDHPLLNSISAETQESKLLKALYAHNTHHYDEAIEIYGRILDGDTPESIRSMVYLHRGMAWFANGDYDRAKSDFQRSLSIAGDNERALLYLGLCERQQGRESAALEQFDRCLEINPRNEEALLSRSQLHFALGDFSGAVRDCDLVLHIDSENRHAQKFRSFLNDQMGV